MTDRIIRKIYNSNPQRLIDIIVGNIYMSVISDKYVMVTSITSIFDIHNVEYMWIDDSTTDMLIAELFGVYFKPLEPTAHDN